MQVDKDAINSHRLITTTWHLSQNETVFSSSGSLESSPRTFFFFKGNFIFWKFSCRLKEKMLFIQCSFCSPLLPDTLTSASPDELRKVNTRCRRNNTGVVPCGKGWRAANEEEMPLEQLLDEALWPTGLVQSQLSLPRSIFQMIVCYGIVLCLWLLFIINASGQQFSLQKEVFWKVWVQPLLVLIVREKSSCVTSLMTATTCQPIYYLNGLSHCLSSFALVKLEGELASHFNWLRMDLGT